MDWLEATLFVVAASAMVLVVILVSSSVAGWFRARKVMAFIVNGDTIIPRPARITPEGVEVDGVVYAAPRDAFKIVKWKGRNVLGVFLDATSNAAYIWKNGVTVKEAPPELLSKLALKRILRQLTRREIQVLPFLLGVMVGGLILAAGILAIYNQIVIPAKQQAAQAQALMGEYDNLKREYGMLKQQYGALEAQYNDLLQRYNMLQSELQRLQAACNVTSVNATVAAGGAAGGPPGGAPQGGGG